MDRYHLTALWRRAQRSLLGDDYDRADNVCRQAPEWLILVVNNFCNLHCRMCDVGLKETSSVFYSHMIGDDPRNMSLPLLRVIVDQAARFSPRPKIGLAFTEPLLHKQILDFCRAIVERNIFCSITTNGFLLPRLAESLVEIGVHEITISIDGPAAVHDEIRGREGSFNNLRTGIELLNQAKARTGRDRPVVRFSYTLTDHNYTHMVDFMREIEDLRPASCNFSHLNFITEEMATVHNARFGGELAMNRSNLGSMDLQSIDLDAMWDALKSLKAYARTRPDAPPVSIVPDLESPDELATYYREPLTFIGGRACTDPWRLLMIKPDGTVIPAHSRCYNITAGNLRETPLTELWNHARVRELRQTLKDAGGTLPACARCCGVIGKPKQAIELSDARYT